MGGRRVTVRDCGWDRTVFSDHDLVLILEGASVAMRRRPWVIRRGWSGAVRWQAKGCDRALKALAEPERVTSAPYLPA